MQSSSLIIIEGKVHAAVLRRSTAAARLPAIMLLLFGGNDSENCTCPQSVRSQHDLTPTIRVKTKTLQTNLFVGVWFKLSDSLHRLCSSDLLGMQRLLGAENEMD